MLRVLALCVLVLPAACSALPPPGAPMRAEVYRPMAAARVGASLPALRNAVLQGLTRDDFAAGRFGRVACAWPVPGGWRAASYPVRLLPGIAGPGETPVEFHPGVEGGGAGPLGEVVRRLPPQPAAASLATEDGARLPRCEGGAGGLLRGRLGEPSTGYWFDSVVNADTWLAWIPPAALEQGRVVTLRCAAGGREARFFHAEVPPGLALARGDVVEARAGVPISSVPGPIALVQRRLEPAPEADAPPRPLVRCRPEA
ncbi:hypothetical protein [Paracraurococcus ruber]|nr:hypothetical protein [Paracraurococcus ruber]TDG13112.1 hypothetical protein E2C05_30360 [Paracraurococcus ruber]